MTQAEELYVRHGDLPIFKVEKLDDAAFDKAELLSRASDGGIDLLDGSHGTPHIAYGEIVAKRLNGAVTLKVAAPSEIRHDRHPTATLEPGFYIVRRLREGNDQAFEAVID